ncbi:MAG: hypothetical protein ACLP7P_18535 [Rhodomicrobium sp.]
MKANQFSAHLGSLAKLFDETHATNAANILRSFAPVFNACDTASVADVVKTAKSCSVEQSRSPSLSQVGSILSSYRRAVSDFAKKPLLDDLDIIISFCNERGTVSIEHFVLTVSFSLTKQSGKSSKARAKPVDETLVSSYVQKIENTYKDQQAFSIVFAELSKRGLVSEGVVREVAKRFSSSITPSTKKAVALERIKAMHDNYIRMEWKDRAQGNKSAA